MGDKWMGPVGVKQIAAGVLVVASLFGAVWGLDKQFVPREVHELDMAAMSEQIIQMQKNTAIQRAEDEVFYWQRKEVELVRDCAAEPWNLEKKNELNEVKRLKEKAEDRLRKLRE
jgi:hypothetical protein